MMLGYVGPDALLPFMSGVAAAAGAVLMFWRYIWRMTKRVVLFPFRRRAIENAAVPADLPAPSQDGPTPDVK